ncbi:MAG: hypothetical protein ACYTAN_02910 [Planctomycetota bacterium]|jgi:hypothetical protein
MDDSIISAAGEGRPSTDLTEEVYPNFRYRHRNIPFALLIWLVVYLVPGILIGQLASRLLGMLWMLAGAGAMAVFVWRSLFPARLVVGRDGFRLERPDRKRHTVDIEVGYGKIHEARWERSDLLWRHLLGPLVFIEPFWLLQRVCRRTLVITHAGPHVVLREDEVARLGQFAETLRGKGILGLREAKRVQPPTFPPFAQR